MLHTPIRPAEQVGPEPDPDVEQAIADFRSLGREIRDTSERLARLDAGDRDRRDLERRIAVDMAALDLRASRIGGGWTGLALLEAIQADIHRGARRVAQPQRASSRTHLDRVQQAVAREATAKRRLTEAQLEMEAATSGRLAAEHAARHFAARHARADRAVK